LEVNMMGKLALVVGAAAGYVLGTRDGRQRYDQIKSRAEALWQDPKVQEKVSQVSQSVSDARNNQGSTTAADSSGTVEATPAGTGGGTHD
jgi:hypothetical protein